MKPLVIIIAGPTATGKTALAVELAQNLNGEVISADSMQIYQQMSIGSAKPSTEEMQGITHHMMDFVSPFSPYTVAQYKEEAEHCIDEILSRKKQPIVAGGTGLYVHSLIYNVDFSQAQADKECRKELENILFTQGNEKLYEMLLQADPVTAQRLHINDTKRVMRALEIFQQTGQAMSEQENNWQQPNEKYRFCLIGLTLERSILYERINARVDRMFEQGLAEEVENLKKQGLNSKHQSMQGIGYKEILDALEGQYSLDEAKEKIKQGSRRYAKRQMTWFKKEQGINWLDITNKNTDDITKEAQEIINLLR